ncbi:MAG: trimethylamine methyltransferase family protein [Acidimicrobiia bacterium]|nr:MAG: trimethylamine methyltransferase family protein [Acidimicrobiia bacterium]
MQLVKYGSPASRSGPCNTSYAGSTRAQLWKRGTVGSSADRGERRSRRGGRRRAARTTQPRLVKPLVNNLPHTEVVSAEGIETIHKASMRLLSETGMLVLDFPRALETFRDNGAKVEDNMVWIDEDTLMHFVSMAPSTFTLLARNAENNLPVGGRNMFFSPAYGPPFASDLDRGRRPGTIADFHDIARLTYMIPDLHHAGGVIIEPNDVDVAERHLDMLMGHITLSDKSFMGSVTHPDNAHDSVTMAEILFGREAIRSDPALLSLISISSPMRMDDRMLGALEVYARANQAMILASFIIVGAMSPPTLAATIAQQNAESLFAIAYAQMLNPGVPCVQGPFLPTVDMKSGAPCFGTPESALALYACAQLARRYGLPFRSGGNYTASPIPDAQAGYESASSIWPTVQAGTNVVLHAAGWLEGGLTTGYEKLILDAEMLGAMAKYVEGIGLTEEDFAWDAYAEAEHGGHFLGTAHTLRHYDTAFYQHKVFNTDSFEKWQEEGRRDAYSRANGIWKQMLKDYEQPDLDAAISEELDAFVAKRRAEIRDGTPRSGWESSR